MIDIENKVIDTLTTALTSYNVPVISAPTNITANLPCVLCYEADNYTYRRTQDTTLTEHQANIAYTVEVYADNINEGKEIAKAIAMIADIAMQNMKFTRTLKNVVPNYNTSIYRIVMRYVAVVNEGITDSQGTTSFQMYRK